MQLKKLDIKQAGEIYIRHMQRDFPSSELKPFSVIRENMQKGLYIFYGCFDGDAFVGYACLFRSSEGLYLLDYFAMLPDRRGQGLGSLAIRAIIDGMAGEGGLLIEVEDPDYAADEAELALRHRRISFYLRNGLANSGLKIKFFGVDFLILSAGVEQAGKVLLPGLRQIYTELAGRAVVDAELVTKDEGGMA